MLREKDIIYIINAFGKLQKRPKNGADPAAGNGRSSCGANQNAQLPAVRIKPLTSEFLQVEHIISKRRKAVTVTVSIYEGAAAPFNQQCGIFQGTHDERTCCSPVAN